MENKEQIYTALEEFCRLPNGAVPDVLDEYLNRVAVTGVTVFPWCNIKPLLHHKLDVVMKEFQERAPVDCQTLCPNVDNVKFEDMHKRLLSALDQFTGTPFTIQRICELVTNPTKHYKKADKFMRGIEKNLAVVTTVDSFGNRIVSESKTLVNGIDALAEQTVAPDQSKMGNSNSFTEQSSSLSIAPVPTSSPAADSSEVNSSGSGSWFANLTTVVDSPNSYPKWRDGDTAASSVGFFVSRGANSSQLPVTDPDIDDELEPPAKRQLLEQASSSPADDDVSTTATVAPLLSQLLSSSVENGGRQSDDEGDGDDAVDDVSATHSTVHSSNTDLTRVPSDESVDDVQHEGISGEESSTTLGSSELSTVSPTADECLSREAYDSDSSNTNSLAAESENDLESSTADLESSESNDSRAEELDMSFTENDNANTCLDDVTDETVRVGMTTADRGPPASAINTVDIKLAATADVDTNDHRCFVGSDRSCGELDTHRPESMLVSRVAMDIN